MSGGYSFKFKGRILLMMPRESHFLGNRDVMGWDRRQDTFTVAADLFQTPFRIPT
jgi:hypothetical protein